MKSSRGPIDVRVLQDNSVGMSNLDFSCNKPGSPLKQYHSSIFAQNGKVRIPYLINPRIYARRARCFRFDDTVIRSPRWKPFLILNILPYFFSLLVFLIFLNYFSLSITVEAIYFLMLIILLLFFCFSVNTGYNRFEIHTFQSGFGKKWAKFIVTFY